MGNILPWDDDLDLAMLEEGHQTVVDEVAKMVRDNDTGSSNASFQYAYRKTTRPTCTLAGS